MATEEELNNQRDLNSEKRQTVDIDKDINSEQEKSLSLEEQILSLLANRRGIDSNILSDQQDINNVLKDQVKNMDFEVIQRKQIRDLSANISKIASDSYSISKDQLGLTSTNTDIVKKQETLSTNIVLLEQQKQQLLNNINNGTASNAQLNKDIADSISTQVLSAGKLKNDLDKVAENSKEISNNFGVKSFGGMSEISKAIPGLSKFSGPFEQAGEASRSMAANIQEAAQSGGKGLTKERIKQLGLEKKLGNLTGSAASNVMKGMSGGAKSMMALKAGAKALGPMLTKALGPVGLIIEAVKAFIQIDKASGETAKSMGISAAEGGRLNAKMADAAAMSGDLLVSSKDVVAANMELNKMLGTSVEFSGELASEFASVKERTGLSEKAMGMFTKNAMAAGTSIKDQLQEVTAITQEMSAQSGIMLNSKDIQEGIAEMSAVQQLNAGRSTAEMARQVFQAKLLGASQSDLLGASSSLLDFESSIGAEMEAELLTGKQLNLEAARAAALAGDTGKLAEELAKNMGTSAEFGAMNVIQQEKMAAAMGLTKEQVAGMLIEQENLEKIKEAGFASASDAQEKYDAALKNGLLTEELKADLAKAGVLNQMESATQADKLAAVMEKITDLFVQLVDPLMPIVDALMAILDPIFAILSPIMKLIGDLVGLIMSALMPSLNLIKSSLGGLAKILTGIFTLDFGMIADGFTGMLSGVLNAITAMLNQAKNMLLDVILSPLDGIINLMNLIPGVEIPDLSTSLGEATDIPQLAKGGVVTGPTQALIGEGSEAEAVLPLSKLASMLPSGVAIGDSILNAATAPMRGIMNTIGSIFDQGDIGGALKNPISGLMDTIGGMFDGDSIIDKVSNVATSPLRGIMDAVGGIFDNDIGDTLLKTITAPMRAVGNLIPSEGVSSAISSFEEDPTGSIGSVFNNVKEGISNILGGGDENKDNEQLKSLNEKMSQLISLIEKGGDVYIDGAKAGKSMVLATSRMG